MTARSYYFNLSTISEFNKITNSCNKCDEDSPKLLKTIVKYENYKIIHYSKDSLTYELIPTYGLFRSVVLNNTNDVVCFSPPKSIPCDIFMSKYSNKTSNIVAEEYIEGTMINVFWDKHIFEWNISTRNTVGGNTYFYKTEKSKTFKTMFFEALQENNLILSELNPVYCYSFVLQHPENRIVVPISKPQLYLVSMYLIDNKDKNNVKVFFINMQDVKYFGWVNTTIKFPKIYEWSSYTDLINNYASMNTSYDIMGVIIYNTDTFERTKIRNPVYEEVKALKGNQPKLQYQYLSLRKEGKVNEFLKYYPENKTECSVFREQIHLFTSTLHNNYTSCYIHKEKQLNQYSNQYKTHMYNLHKMYIDELREKKLYITKQIVINYVNNLHPSLLMHSLNYNMNKQTVDGIKAETQTQLF